MHFLGGQKELTTLTPSQQEKGNIPYIKLVHKSLFEIWESSRYRCNIQKSTFNPSPKELDKSSPYWTLNTYGGFKYNRDDVLQCTNWPLMYPILRHCAFTWCKTEEEFTYLLCWLAHIFQRPEEKTDIAFGLGGDEGSGKSFFFKK